MRTTLTIDDQLLSELKQTAHASGKPLKQVVNEALYAGLEALKHPPQRSYRLTPASLGAPRPEIDLTKAFDSTGRESADLCRQR